MTSGTVFNIQKFSVNDGPGIRTTVFLKGCPLNCLWCHNPESKHTRPELMYTAHKCVSCGKCVRLCPHGCHTVGDGGIHNFDRTACVGCGACTAECYSEALSLAGETKSVNEVIAEVLKDKPFYDNSGGGMTLSGGEPMLQFEFTLALLKAAKDAGLHTAIETCGYAKAEEYRAILPFVDVFLFDYKETDREKHRVFTGVYPDRIRENLALLNDCGAHIVLRCPIIPTLNDREDHLIGIAETANAFPAIREINVEPYHPLGNGKSEMLGIDYALRELSFPSDESVKSWIDVISAHTSVPVKKA